jgi:glycosyltransferase involved in cell wall biosynthesis
VCTTDACDRHQRLPVLRGRHGSVDVRVFPNRSNRLAYELQFFTPKGLGRYLAEEASGFDIVHIHGHRHLLQVTAARWCRQAGVPYVSAPNGTAARIERRAGVKRVWDVMWGHADLAGAAAVMAVSEAERRQLLELGVQGGQIRVVPNPLDLDEYDPPPARGRWRQRLGIEGPLVVFLGRLSPRKRVDVVISAMAAPRNRATTLVVAGNDMGAAEAARAQVADLGLERSVIFHDLITGRDRLELLADADVVVYPSADEVFGLVPLEALLSGTPAIVADDSGCGEVVAELDGGQVVPLGDAAALAEAIARVVDERDAWRQRAECGGWQVRSRYGGPVVAERIDALYAEVLAR